MRIPTTGARERRVITRGLLCMLLAVSPGGSAAQSIFETRDEDFSFGGVVFPSVADTFAVLDVRRWPQAHMGVAIHYASPLDSRARFDVYVYAWPDSILLAMDEQERIAMEFEGALESISEYREDNPEGVAVEVEAQGAVSVTAGGTAYEGRRGVATLRRGTEARQSLLYVFEKEGRRIKYRITYGRSLRALMEPRVEAFLVETLARIRTAGAPRRRDPGPTHEGDG